MVDGKETPIDMKNQTNPSEIVDIHFSYKKFKTYEILIEID